MNLSDMECKSNKDNDKISDYEKIQQLELVLKDCDDEDERKATQHLILELHKQMDKKKNDTAENIPLPSTLHKLTNKLYKNGKDKLQSEGSEMNKCINLLSSNNINETEMQSIKKLPEETDAKISVVASEKLATQTRIGKITLQKNKLVSGVGVGVGKTSIFEIDGDGGKEVGLRLQRLRKLKKLQKPSNNSIDKSPSSSVTTVSEPRKLTIEMRIAEWRNELMKDMSDEFTRKRNKRHSTHLSESSDVFLVVNNLKESMNASKVKNEACTAEKSDFHFPKKSYPSVDTNEDYITVTASNGVTKLLWPIEMLRTTRIAPSINFSVNPLRFNFEKLKEISDERDQVLVSEKTSFKHERSRFSDEEESERDGKLETKNCGWETSSNESISYGRRSNSRYSSRHKESSRHRSISWSSTSSRSYSKESYRSYSVSHRKRRYSRKSRSPSLSRSRSQSRIKSNIYESRRKRSLSESYSRSRSKSNSKYRSKSGSKYRNLGVSKYISKSPSRSKSKDKAARKISSACLSNKQMKQMKMAAKTNNAITTTSLSDLSQSDMHDIPLPCANINLQPLDIPLPIHEKFQVIGPNDPLVFKPKDKNLSKNDKEKPSSSHLIMPPEQLDSYMGDPRYRGLRLQAEKHAKRQMGIEVEEDDDTEEEWVSTEPTVDPLKQRIIDGIYKEQAAALAQQQQKALRETAQKLSLIQMAQPHIIAGNALFTQPIFSTGQIIAQNSNILAHNSTILGQNSNIMTGASLLTGGGLVPIQIIQIPQQQQPMIITGSLQQLQNLQHQQEHMQHAEQLHHIQQLQIIQQLQLRQQLLGMQEQERLEVEEEMEKFLEMEAQRKSEIEKNIKVDVLKLNEGDPQILNSSKESVIKNSTINISLSTAISIESQGKCIGTNVDENLLSNIQISEKLDPLSTTLESKVSYDRLFTTNSFSTASPALPRAIVLPRIVKKVENASLTKVITANNQISNTLPLATSVNSTLVNNTNSITAPKQTITSNLLIKTTANAFSLSRTIPFSSNTSAKTANINSLSILGGIFNSSQYTSKELIVIPPKDKNSIAIVSVMNSCETKSVSINNSALSTQNKSTESERILIGCPVSTQNDSEISRIKTSLISLNENKSPLDLIKSTGQNNTESRSTMIKQLEIPSSTTASIISLINTVSPHLAPEIRPIESRTTTEIKHIGIRPSVDPIKVPSPQIPLFETPVSMGLIPQTHLRLYNSNEGVQMLRMQSAPQFIIQQRPREQFIHYQPNIGGLVPLQFINQPLMQPIALAGQRVLSPQIIHQQQVQYLIGPGGELIRFMR